jgi:hypothetical protein
MSMALQSAALLCRQLLGPRGTAAVPDGRAQAGLQHDYAAAWRLEFAPRLRLAAAFAHLAMRPRSAAVLMQLARRWPDLLTRGARWGGKVRYADLGGAAGTPPAVPSAVEVRTSVSAAAPAP